MKKIFIITLAFGLAISVANFTSSAYAANWSVPGDFATIQDAIDDASVNDGDTIRVGQGEHAGATVTKAVEIKGQGGAVINEGAPGQDLQLPIDCMGIPTVYNIGFRIILGGSGATISHLKFEDVAFPVYE